MAGLSSLPRFERQADNRPSLAVLPFTLVDGSGDHFLSDGITEDVITELSRYRDIMVIGRGSSFQLRPLAHDLGQVAAELGVRYVLSGSVRRSGTLLRITGHLVDARTSAQVWSDRLDAAMDDILAMQADLANRVAGSVIPGMMQAEHQRAERLPLADVPAYELALKASNVVSRGYMLHDMAVLSEGIGMARQAAEADPTCLRAQYALAFGYCRRGTMGYIGADTAGDLKLAMEAALRLRDIDPRSHVAYAIMGHIDMRLLRHTESLANLQQAHHLNPNDVTTLRWLSWETANHGLADDAAAQAALSIRLSPRDKFIDRGYWALALAAYVGNDLAACVENARRAVAMNRAYGGHYVLLAASLAESGAREEASRIAAGLLRDYPGLLESRLAGRTYFVSPALTARYQAALEVAAGQDASAGQEAAGTTGMEGLSGREREVLRLVARGASNGAVAAALGLSEHTVKRHVANILTKLDLPTRAAAVAQASRMGLL